MKRLLKYIQPYRKEFILSLVCMLIFGVSDGAIPLFVKQILDGVFAEHNVSMLYKLPIILVGFTCLRALCDFGQSYLTSRIGHSIVRDLRNEVNAHVLELPASFFIKTSPADIIARITSDVIMVRSLLTDSLTAVLRDSVRIVALVAAAFYLDPFLAAIAFIGVPIGILPVAKFGKKVRKLSKKGQDDLGGLGAIMQETVVGNRVVKAFLGQAYERQRFETQSESLTKTMIKSDFSRALSGPINEVLASLAVAGVVLYGGLSVINNDRTQGQFIAFLVSVFLMYDPFKKLSRVYAVLQQGFSGADRIFELFGSAKELDNAAPEQVLGKDNSIEFSNVDFQYRTGVASLNGINLKVAQGSRVAIVGLSGAGKSTLVDLIPRFMHPSTGSVTIGGVDIAKVGLKDLRSRIALVSQHTFLFNESIYNNILYGRRDATRAEVEEAARAAYAFDFIVKLKDGFETVIGEQGLTLSGGERQRIAIARAILKNAPILILDEATAALDNKSEREVQLALEALQHGRTSVIIAHRLSTVRDANLIVVMKAGQIVEMGTHDQLLNAKGEYAYLYSLQYFEADTGVAPSPQPEHKHVAKENIVH